MMTSEIIVALIPKMSAGLVFWRNKLQGTVGPTTPVALATNVCSRSPASTTYPHADPQAFISDYVTPAPYDPCLAIATVPRAATAARCCLKKVHTHKCPLS